MSKYQKLWEEIARDKRENFTLSFDKIATLGGIPIDHAFLNFKKELLAYGYEVGKISLKNKTVNFSKIVTNPTDKNFAAELAKKFDTYDEEIGLSFPSGDFQLQIAPNDEFRAGLVAGRMGTCLDIRKLFVEKSFRKQGLGGILLEKAEEYAREQGIRYLTVNTLSVYAPDYYPRHGFQTYHILHDCPIVGIDLLRMQKEL